MPQLPTLTVSDAQAQRMIAAFGSVENYKKWLKEQIVEYVVQHEQSGRLGELEQQYFAEVDRIRNELNQ